MYIKDSYTINLINIKNNIKKYNLDLRDNPKVILNSILYRKAVKVSFNKLILENDNEFTILMNYKDIKKKTIKYFQIADNEEFNFYDEMETTIRHDFSG